MRVPQEWTDEVLADHVAGIVFDGDGDYEPECVLCQKAVALGLFARYGWDLPHTDERPS